MVNPKELRAIIKPWIENNNTIFSLYDLESTYGKFLEMNTIINSVYNEIRNNQSKIIFKKALEDLTKEELAEIKQQIPMHHVWSYSIPHYNSIVEKENSFFGLKIN